MVDWFIGKGSCVPDKQKGDVMRIDRILTILLLSGVLVTPVWGQNLQPNADFSDPDDPLASWNYDYEWTGNRNYVGNAERVSVLPREGGRRNVLQITGLGDVGSKVETIILPYEEGMTYRARVSLRGGPYRIYFSGYSWRPGIRPHDEPELKELRPIYRSKTEAGSSRSWRTIDLEIPGVDATELSQQHLRRVRFVTLYIWAERMTHVDQVRITRH